jgi:hypothetical protein
VDSIIGTVIIVLAAGIITDWSKQACPSFHKPAFNRPPARSAGLRVAADPRAILVGFQQTHQCIEHRLGTRVR